MFNYATRQAMLDRLEAQEMANGAVSVEYVIIVCLVVGLGAALIAFQTQISKFITTASTNLNTLFTNLSSGLTKIPS